MGDIADQLIDEEMFGYNNGYSYKPRGNKKPKGKYRKTAHIHLTPSEQKIASVRKEIAILCSEGIQIENARKLMNEKYGKGWRSRGLCVNDENQWSDDDLREFIRY